MMKKFILIIFCSLIFTICPYVFSFAEDIDNPAPPEEEIIQEETTESETTEAATGEEDPETPPEEEPLEAASPEGGDSSAPAMASFNSQILQSFQTDLFTGKASLSIPIQVPPGRGGMQPNLSLIYQSGGGNTWCGLGWMLDTGSISRSTKKGTPKYDDTDTFIFNFNGSTQELVEIFPNQYRAKTESSFMKFQYIDPYWLVTDTKGTEYYFGQTASSRQQKDDNNIYSWCLDKVIDINTNYMSLTYTKDQNQIYPQTISYTGNQINSQDPKYTVTFTTEDRDDKNINYRSGIKVTTAKRLKEIDIKYNTELIKKYLLQYYLTTDFNKTSLLKSVALYGSDETLLPPVEFEYEDVNHVFNSPTTWPGVSQYPGSTSEHYEQIRFQDSTAATLDIFDINGDGLPDRVMVNVIEFPTNDWYVQLNTGNGFATPTPWTGASTYPGSTSQHYRQIRFYDGADTMSDVLDVNGDGLPDRVMVDASVINDWYVQLNTGNGFATPTPWPGVSQYPDFASEHYEQIRFNDGGDTRLDIFDINGDGLLDRVMASGFGFTTDDWYVQPSQNMAALLLTQVSNGIGGTTEITYKSYKGADNSEYDPEKLLPFSTWVVDAITQDPGFGRPAAITAYEYDYGYFDFTEREFRGFRYVKTKAGD